MNAISSANGVDARDVKHPAPTNSAPPGAGRDSSGRFTAGNKSEKGNPFARRTARLRSILLEAVTDEDMQVIAQKLLEQAKAGDLAAIKLLFGYVIGKPIPCSDPDRLDLDEWSLRQAAPAAKQVLELERNTHYPPDLACLFARLILEQNEENVCLTIARAKGMAVADPASAQASHNAPADGGTRTAPPSPNGRSGHAPPSANGRNGHAVPPTGRTTGHVRPSANGKNGHAAASPNGANGRHNRMLASSLEGQLGERISPGLDRRLSG